MSTLNIIRDNAVLLLISGLLYVLVGASPMHAADHPNSKRRILFNSDGGNALCEFWINWPDKQRRFRVEEIDAAGMKAIAEDSIDEMAEAGVNTFSSVVWYAFKASGWIVKNSAEDMTDCRTRDGLGYLPLYKAGYDAVQIMIDRCHRNGMNFLGCFRMNDRHRHGDASGLFILNNPQWQMKGAAGGPGMNFAYEPVREKLFAYVEDLVTSYPDIDGVEYDYMRWCHMFEPGEGKQNAHLLTEFMRKTRRLLDRVEGVRERRIVGVRVAQTMEECEYLGFDVATWMKEDLVDWVVPSDFHYTDLNTRVEDFVKLAEGTDCKIYPAIHPVICRGDDTRVMSLANYRAAAQNFYAHGAHGIQTYNYQYHWGRRQDTHRPEQWDAYMWPTALGYLRKLADPQNIAQNNRHYRFFRLWPKANTGAIKDHRIKLDRAKKNPWGSQHFRMAEDLSNPRLRASIQFKAVGMGLDENLEIQLNGRAVPARMIRHLFDEDGQNKWQGRVLDPFYLYVINLDRGSPQPLIINGDNELTVRLIPTEEQTGGLITIDELEVYVYVTGQ